MAREPATMPAPTQKLMMSSEKLTEMLALISDADSVELKASVPDNTLRSAVAALGMDPIEAQIRQVAFFDTPDLQCNQAGVVVRARRVQSKTGDVVVKLRPVVPHELPASLRASSAFGVEVDAQPGGFVCSATMKAPADNAVVRATWAGERSVRKLFSKEQRAFFAAHAPEGVELDALAMLGPITAIKLKFPVRELKRRMVAELWFYPDGSRILELSTKSAPTEAVEVALLTRAYLTERGIDLTGEQQMKTKTALKFFARELATPAAVS